MKIIFDVEADGLLDEATKLHCLSYTELGSKEVHTVYTYDEMREVLLNATTLIGHDIHRYDVPVVERLLDIKLSARLIDTLALSWYLNHQRMVHGLDSYGKEFGIPKPKIDDWENLTPEEYGHRCEEDVKINRSLWNQLRKKLMKIYGDKDNADRLIKYLSFKMDCLREQQRSQWKLDLPKAKLHAAELEQKQEEKILQLQQVMPPRKLKAKRTRPAKPFKKDGSWSVTGARWFNLLRELGYSEDFRGVIEVEVGEEPANPNSHDQVKEWLFSLGWKPESFKFDGDRKIPQVRVDGENGKELCPSVLKLAEKEPGIEVLEGLSVIQHRLGIFNGFINNEVAGWVTAEAQGFTNTLRFKHKNPLVNLPGVDKPWGKEIRGCLIAPEGMVLCGSDMVSLESNTKKHYMFPHDPDYVEEMSHPDFDEHLDLAKQAGAATQEQILAYVTAKREKDLDNAIIAVLDPIRKHYKPANYACVYGVQAARLARDTKVSKGEAQKLIDTYWQRNWSIQKVVEDLFVKEVDGEKWLFNPVSRFYYSLRFEKDRFSTLNQSTGVFCFDRWVATWRKVRSQLTGQFHDEIIACIPEGKEEAYEKILRRAIDIVNNQLKLNIKLDIDVQFGKTYAEIH